MKQAVLVAALALCALTALTWTPAPDTPRVPPTPPTPLVAPAPTPAPEPDRSCPNCPRPPRRDRDTRPPFVACQPAPDQAREPTVDLLSMPSQVRPRNVGGRDGAGLCVFTSIQYAAWYQNEPRLQNFQQVMRQELGGGWPEKVDKMVAKYGPGTPYVQYSGKDTTLMELALKTGRVPCVTVMRGAHMVCLVHLDANSAAIVDNNAPDRVQWMTRAQFIQSHDIGGRGGWTFVLLNPTCPPPPHNGTPAPRSVRCCPCPVCGCDPCQCDRCDDLTPDLPAPVYGVTWTPPEQETWSVCGVAATRRVVMDQLTDDSQWPHLTVIGDRETQARVRQIAGIAAGWRVQYYTPDAWALRCGFATSQPCVYLQRPDGEVLARLDALRADLASCLGERLRRARPDYDPSKDPQGGNSLGELFGGLQFLSNLRKQPLGTWGLLGAGGLAAAWYVGRRSTPAAPVVPPPVPVARQPAPPGDPLSQMLERVMARQREAMVQRLEEALLTPATPTPKKESANV